jgi:hypothetical protein
VKHTHTHTHTHTPQKNLRQRNKVRKLRELPEFCQLILVSTEVSKSGGIGGVGNLTGWRL